MRKKERMKERLTYNVSHAIKPNQTKPNYNDQIKPL